MVGEDTFFNLLKEYWPDIRLKMFKRKHPPDSPF